jgi:hypothetical protein
MYRLVPSVIAETTTWTALIRKLQKLREQEGRCLPEGGVDLGARTNMILRTSERRREGVARRPQRFLALND